jgi:hypothetical protein
MRLWHQVPTKFNLYVVQALRKAVPGSALDSFTRLIYMRYFFMLHAADV